MLREVFQTIVHAQSLDLQAGFIALYAALEMRVLSFRRNHNLEFVISNLEDWKVLHNDLGKFISSHPLLAGNTPDQKAKRLKAHEKVSEFNRVAFGTAFNACCSQTSQPIPHQDLWPVNGKNSLSWLRNRLVHGELQGQEDVTALWHAKMHIEWLVERSILCLLSWPIKKSRVTPEYLSELTPYDSQNWEASRASLFF